MESKWRAICRAVEGGDLGIRRRHQSPEGFVPLGMQENKKSDNGGARSLEGTGCPNPTKREMKQLWIRRSCR